jgi:uncharacterized protein YjiS (DUF1127 family)
MNCNQDCGSANAASHAPMPHGGLPFFSAGSRLLNYLYLWQSRIDEQRELARIDERLLKDAGISRADIAQEASKPFWRA